MAQFRVTDVNENVMSAGKTIRLGNFKAVLDKDESYLQSKKKPDIKIPLFLRRNSFYLKVRTKGIPPGQQQWIAAPVGELAEPPSSQPAQPAPER